MTGHPTSTARRTRPARWKDADELRWAVRHWAGRIGVPTPAIHLRAMRTKWASMSSAGRVTLDASLLKLPRDLGEYVIVHELVHRLVPNHGRVFKSFLFAYLPDWERRDSQLRAIAAREAPATRSDRVACPPHRVRE